MGRIVGANFAIYDQRPEDSNKIKEWINIFKGDEIVLHCYGVGKMAVEMRMGQRKL